MIGRQKTGGERMKALAVVFGFKAVTMAIMLFI